MYFHLGEAGFRGLSPQERGNRFSLEAPWRWLGPIPAGAGEPLISRILPACLRAYPRRSGGT